MGRSGKRSVAVDAVKGFPDELYLEVKLWSEQGQQLAVESLYDEPEEDGPGDPQAPTT